MKPLDLILLAPESWRPMEPSTGRGSNRTSERELDRAPARIVVGSQELAVKLWDYSPFGFSVLVPHGTRLPAGIQAGGAAVLSLALGPSSVTCPCKVENVAQFRGQLRIGLSRTDLVECLPNAQDELKVGDSLILWGETRNPLLYGEWCSMRLVAVRPGMRLVFTSLDPSMVLFPGMELDVELGVPTSGDNLYRGKVTSLCRQGPDTVAAVVEPLQVSARLAAELGELLSVETGASPGDLKTFGFPVTFLRDRLLFRHAEGPEDMAQIAALRDLASRETSRTFASPAAFAMPEKPDADLRILCGFHGDILVAAAVIGFPRERETYLRDASGTAYDQAPDYPGSSMELLDIATHPDYRRGDLWLGLAERISRIFLLSGRDRLLRVCEERLLTLYRRMGFRDAAGNASKAGSECRLVQLDRDTVLRGKGVGLAAWETLYGDLVEDFLQKRLIEPAAWEALALRLKLKLKPWFRSQAAARSERIFQQCIRK